MCIVAEGIEEGCLMRSRRIRWRGGVAAGSVRRFGLRLGRFCGGGGVQEP